MPLIRLSNIAIAFGTHALLNRENFQIDLGERVGLLGRNGEGKSTLMKIIAGSVLPDSGDVWRQPELKLATLDQSPELSNGLTIYDAVAQGLGELGSLIARYHQLSVSIHGDKELAELGELQHKLEALQGWHFNSKIETTLSKLGLDGDQKVEGLSGGWKRRVALAKALVVEPQLLLLDEPTNHLDLDSIAWLEEQSLNFNGAIVFVTHDRAFLQKLATRIVELDRGNLVSWPGNYQDYLQRKAAALDDEANQNAEFDKKLAQEEVWIRQGIKARRTRNEGRVRALKKLREERAQRRNLQGNSTFSVETAEASGKKVIAVHSISFSYLDLPVIRDFSTVIQRGDKIGLIGANGSGKTTLLKLLLKQIEPQSGDVEHGTRLEIAYFDQLRDTLDPEMTVVDTVADGSDFVEIAGIKRHVMSYLADFLFPPVRARSPVKSLSGGEKNRLLLAKLLAKPANLLVMDEPTNDLDLETLELLEDKLVNYNGTLLLVSHDRTFLDNVVTSVFALDGKGNVKEYIGGYSDWLRQRTHTLANDKAYGKQEKTSEDNNDKQPMPVLSSTRKKLSYKEQQELTQLPKEIERLEERQVALNEIINDPEFYKSDQTDINNILAELEKTSTTLEQSYLRWDELETLHTG
jgi:ATP-binding cassette subfamily F protein uup